MFDKWLGASDVYAFKELQELMVLEQFEQSLLKVMQTYLNDLDPKTVCKAADNYGGLGAWHLTIAMPCIT